MSNAVPAEATPRATNKAKVYSYRRFSTPDQLAGDSLRRQSSMAEAWAAARRLELDQELTFEDLGVSAFRGRNVDQGALGEFLRAIEIGIVEPGSILLVESLDRLSRQTARRALRSLEGIVDAGVKVVTLDTGREYTTETLDSDPMALIEIVLRATLAHDESVKKSQRIRAAWEGKRQEATTKPLTSRGPGWMKLTPDGWQLIADRAAVVKRIFDLTAQGMGAEGIGELLNREKVPVFGRGKWWHRTYVLKILENAAVIGEMQPHTMTFDSSGKKRRERVGEPIEGYYPAVIDASLWETVQAMRSSRQPKVKRNGVLRSLLAGLATCPLCGSTMTRVMKGDVKKAGKPKFVCSKAKIGAGCTYHGVDCETVEKALIAGIDRAAAEARLPDAQAETRLEAIEKEIAGTEDAIERLLDALQKAPGSAALVGRLTDLERTLSALQDQRATYLKDALLSDPRGYLRRQSAAVEAVTKAPLDRVKANAALRGAVKRIVINWPDGTLDLDWLGDGVSSVQFGWPKEAGIAAPRPRR